MNIPIWLKTVFLLLCSNCFMTIAWYGHLKFKHTSIFLAIFVSWLLALPEYALQVPANRIGSETFSAYQLKILQECITFVVFIIFAWIYLGEAPTWRTLLSLFLIFLAVIVGFPARPS